MMNDSLLNIYSNYHPEFLNSLEMFSENNKKKLLKKLTNEQSEISFRSTVAEIQFGELFNKLGFQIEYDKKFFNNQTPDWTTSFDNSSCICEVYRLGKSDKDQIRSNFENQLIDKLEKLPYEYFINIYFLEEYFDTFEYDIALIVKEVENWLSESEKKLSEKIFVQQNFEFEIVKINTQKNHICCAGNANSIEIKSAKLKQYQELRQNEITKKLKKYNEIISENGLSFFIGVSIDFVSGFNFEDFKEYFLGKTVEFIDYDKPKAKLEQFNHYGKTWTELGEFYNNLHLSGVIILYGGIFHFLINPNYQQVIHQNKNQSIKEKLLSLNGLPDNDSVPSKLMYLDIVKE